MGGGLGGFMSGGYNQMDVDDGADEDEELMQDDAEIFDRYIFEEMYNVHCMDVQVRMNTTILTLVVEEK